MEQLPDEPGAPVLKVTGELDISNVGSLRSVVDATFGTSLDRIVFDLSELDFMDSSGLAMLLSVAERTSTRRAAQPEARDPQDHRADRPVRRVRHHWLRFVTSARATARRTAAGPAGLPSPR